ncbi:MAG: heme ABC transporter ATP-binding protein [Flavisolibacter sp.]
MDKKEVFMLRAANISFKAGNKILLHDTSIHFAPGRFHVVMGANGAGKSTLLKLLAGDQKPSSGKIYFGHKELDQYSKKELATRRAVLSQHYNITFPITANEIVLMGRYPYFTASPTRKDVLIQQEVMQLMQVADFAERDYNTLSGGEAQKVQMSRVLAQIWNDEKGEEKILFLDEPVSHLDVKYQYQLLQTAKKLCSEHTTVIAVLHDINLAISFADSIVFMKAGKIVHEVDELAAINTAMIDEVFDVRSKIIYPEGHKPVVIF